MKITKKQIQLALDVIAKKKLYVNGTPKFHSAICRIIETLEDEAIEENEIQYFSAYNHVDFTIPNELHKMGFEIRGF